MKLPKKNCAACSRPFIPRRRDQRYCCEACRRLGYRQGLCDHRDEEADTAIRAFSCAQCGKLVKVTVPGDKRQKFCSARCERLYWKHRKAEN